MNPNNQGRAEVLVDDNWHTLCSQCNQKYYRSDNKHHICSKCEKDNIKSGHYNNKITAQIPTN
jgi:predicted amidophosphoribosyltransferase